MFSAARVELLDAREIGEQGAVAFAGVHCRSSSRRQRVDTEMIDQQRPRPYHVADGDAGKGQGRRTPPVIA